MRGSRWFKRLVKEITRMSPHFKIKHAKYGFYRIYWKNAYIHEVYDNMPFKGYDIEEEDLRNMSQTYFQEFEDSNEITRKIKNYVEGYWDSYDRIKTRLYLLKHDSEFRDNAQKAYRQFVVK